MFILNLRVSPHLKFYVLYTTIFTGKGVISRAKFPSKFTKYNERKKHAYTLKTCHVTCSWKQDFTFC